MARIWSSLKATFCNRFIKVKQRKRSDFAFKDPFVPDPESPNWEFRRADDWPTAHDIPSIHEILRPFLDELDPEIVVYAHGSFARGLQTNSLDINLYIPSHRRGIVEEIWRECELRKPSFENPNVGETIEVHLRDLLGKEMTLCFSDDPWTWVERDVRVRVYPSLEENWVQPSGVSVDLRTQVLQKMRKCWYLVKRFETDGGWKWRAYDQTNVSVQSPREDANQGGDRENQGRDRENELQLAKAIMRVSGSLEDIKRMDWRTVAPELARAVEATPSLRALSHKCYKAFYIKRDNSKALWESFALRFRAQTVGILSVESIIFP
jgi:hypothetical protein